MQVACKLRSNKSKDQSGVCSRTETSRGTDLGARLSIPAITRARHVASYLCHQGIIRYYRNLFILRLCFSCFHGQPGHGVALLCRNWWKRGDGMDVHVAGVTCESALRKPLRLAQ